MPSSDPQTIPKVIKMVEMIQPRMVLDVGCGNGRYGFLFREVLDWNWGRIKKEQWVANIDGIDIESDYINPIHKYVYNRCLNYDWMEIDLDEHYDLIFMGDVLEHFSNWEDALQKAIDFSFYTIVVAPNWNGSIAQGIWHGHESEVHKVSLTPAMLKGRCIFANSKCFITLFDNQKTGLFDAKDVLE